MAAKKETAKKADVKATEAAAAVTKEAVKKETAKKDTAKPETVKKAPAKKAEPKSSVVIEYAGGQVSAKDIVTKATKAFTKANKGVTIKKIDVYVKPEEGVAYYVVNGVGSDEYKVSL